MPDNINHPSHYTQGKYETIDIIRDITDNYGYAGFECVCVANVLKYVIRAKNKNGVEDLRKAMMYLTWLIEEVEKNGGGEIRTHVPGLTGSTDFESVPL